MNYAQEKYVRANKLIHEATGRHIKWEEIDRILAIFATVPQVTATQWREAVLNEIPSMRDAINAVLAKQGTVIAASPVEGMVSLKDVEKAIRADYNEGGVAYADREVSRVLSRLTKPGPTTTLLDPTGGLSMEVPASVVHEESSAQLDWEDQHGRNEELGIGCFPPEAAAHTNPTVKTMEYPEVVTYTHKRIYDSDADICNLCGSVVVNQAKHTAFHRRAVR